MHVGGPAEPFEAADDHGCGIGLVPERAVARRLRVCVMEVVKRLAHRDQGQPRDVAAPVARGDGASQHHPDRTGPQKCCERSPERPRTKPSEPERHDESADGEPTPASTDPDQVRVGQQVGRKLLLVRWVGVE